MKQTVDVGGVIFLLNIVTATLYRRNSRWAQWLAAMLVIGLLISPAQGEPDVPPVIIVLGSNPATNECHTAYADPGALARNVVVPLAAGYYHSLALRSDGTVIGWGSNGSGQTTVPASATNIVAIAADGLHSLALCNDGTVIGWGHNGQDQTTVPASATNIVAIAAGGAHSLALRNDGTVISWGYNGQGQTTVPASATNIVAIAAGYYHSLALRADGTVFGWGDNTYGQITVPASATNIVAIAAGGLYSLALRNDGTVISWGYNGQGQTTLPASATNIMAIAAGGAHSLALRADGTVFGWGDNAHGQITVPASATNIVAIAAGEQHSLALRSDGTVLAWGYNAYGQANVPDGLSANTSGRVIARSAFNPGILGAQTIYYSVDGAFGGTATATRTVVVRDTTPPFLTPNGDNPLVLDCPVNYNDPGATATDPCVGVASIAAGYYHSLALRSDGTVLAWGYNAEGQTDVPAGATNIVAIAGGALHNLALRRDGTVLAWGYNDFGQATVPDSATNIVAIAAGEQHSLALRSDGAVVAWGWNVDGQTNVPASATNIMAIAGGRYFSLALRSDGTVLAWGDNNDGQASVPASATNIMAIAAGGSHSLALRSDGTVLAWGYDAEGQTSVPASATNIMAIAGGYYHSLALRSDGSVLAWGYDYFGQTDVPASATNIVAIAAGFGHNLALRSDGAVLAWGYNAYGQTTVPSSLSDAITNITVTGTIDWGTNTLTYAATDPSGNTGTVQRTVIVVDTTAPAISACAPTQSTNSDSTGFCTVPDFTSHIAASDNCAGVLNIVQSPTAGTQLSPGTYPVTLTVTDVSGNSNQCGTTFDGVDHTPPFITQCATNRQIATGPSCQATVPDLTGEIIAADNSGFPVTIEQSPPAGTSVGLSVITVDFLLRDPASNFTNCSMNLTVVDTTPPSITCPSNIVTAATNGTDAVVSFADPIVSDNCTGTVTVASVPPSGSAFPIGTNTVACTATDAAGNTNTCSFTVIVADITPPSITCSSNLVVNATSGAGAVVNFTNPVVSDNSAGTVDVACVPASGSTFPIGTNTVACTATDAAGNTNTCSFTVTVVTGSLTITKQQAKVNFVKPLADSTSFTANLGLPADFGPANQVVTVDIAGISTAFTLDTKGKSKMLGASCTLKPNKLGGWTITVKLAKGTWSGSWTGDGLTNETIANKPVALPVTVIANSHVFTGQKPLLYKAKAGKGGAAK